MYYPSSENKGADLLRSYCEAGLRLCFRICKLLVFPLDGSNSCIVRRGHLDLKKGGASENVAEERGTVHSKAALMS